MKPNTLKPGTLRRGTWVPLLTVQGVIASVVLFFLLMTSIAVAQNEVIPDTNTEVLIREHPQTGEPFVTIVPKDQPERKDLALIGLKKYSRPDYRLLDPKIKSGKIPYDGPYSSRKKIYILAATLATVGAVGAIAAPAAFPATGAAAAGGGGSGLGVGVGAVAATGAGTAAATIKIDSEIPDDYKRAEETRLLEMQSDFYQMHIQKNPKFETLNTK